MNYSKLKSLILHSPLTPTNFFLVHLVKQVSYYISKLFFIENVNDNVVTKRKIEEKIYTRNKEQIKHFKLCIHQADLPGPICCSRVLFL